MTPAFSASGQHLEVICVFSVIDSSQSGAEPDEPGAQGLSVRLTSATGVGFASRYWLRSPSQICKLYMFRHQAGELKPLRSLREAFNMDERLDVPHTERRARRDQVPLRDRVLFYAPPGFDLTEHRITGFEHRYI